MRTTLTIDDDVLEMARTLAQSRRISLGEAISELARRGVSSKPHFEWRDGVCVFKVDPSAPRFGPEEIQAALDADDLEYAKYFRKPGE